VSLGGAGSGYNLFVQIKLALTNSSLQVLLLHGTKPENLHSILFTGLDPEVSKEGLFGKGTYFAESAAKVRTAIQGGAVRPSIQ
jgi:RNA:NAD 2'-phosphotransferase (TPT1/KptA family)